ncbi:biotin transporter BioY [Viridibacillus sp. FSL R5-0477]|uniref:Biotin transporter n=1 Tax=Viridibacillus arenosi FSL R5-213 TaxID=1227360 RepID=W4F114_9BACL|nr:biotin transporter BioY [Viridibacillus arenosi]ETT86533.1 bioY protein [Viridibacillus arenosi FSL R5-213]
MNTKDMVMAALFAAVIAVLGLIPPIPLSFIPVPITAQTLGIMLAGSFLGRKVGTLSVLVFLALVALGTPLLSGGRGGLSVFMGPSVGYLISWLIAAFAIGYLTEKFWDNMKVWKLIIVNFVGGVLLINIIGAPVMAIMTDTSIWASITGAIAFLPGDSIKAVVAAIIAVQLKAVSPIKKKTLVISQNMQHFN